MRRTIAIIAVLLAAVGFASAQGYHYVEGHTTKNGTYVPGHNQTNPSGTINDNWSTQGNTNPFTGKPGTIPQNPQQPA